MVCNDSVKQVCVTTEDGAAHLSEATGASGDTLKSIFFLGGRKWKFKSNTV